MALLHMLCDLSKERPLSITALHVNYHLRGEESDGDEAFVREQCASLGVPLRVHAAYHANTDEPNIQSWARRVRYDFFIAAAAAFNLTSVVTAHHRDDQLETILARLIRGTGPNGIRGIRPKNGVIIRPLLTVPKRAINEYIVEHAVPFRTDSSNASKKYTRNRIRHELIPALTAVSDCSDRIISFANIVSAQHRSLMHLMRRAYPGLVDADGGLDLTVFASLSEPVQREAVRAFLAAALPPSRRTIENVLALIRSPKPNIITAWQSTVIVKEYGRLCIVHTPALPPFDIPLEEGETVFPFGTISVRYTERTGNETLTGCDIVFDAQRATVSSARSRRPGDSLSAFPNGIRKKVKAVFIDRKVPRRLRSLIPMITATDGSILAVPAAVFGYGDNVITASSAVGPHTQRIGTVSIRLDHSSTRTRE